MAKKVAKEAVKKNNSNTAWIVIGAIALVLVLLILFISGNKEDITDEPESPTEEEPAISVETLGEYETKVVYKRVPGVPTEEYRKDCEEVRAGRFNSCGNGCAPGAQICDASCYYICELS